MRYNSTTRPLPTPRPSSAVTYDDEENNSREWLRCGNQADISEQVTEMEGETEEDTQSMAAVEGRGVGGGGNDDLCTLDVMIAFLNDVRSVMVQLALKRKRIVDEEREWARGVKTHVEKLQRYADGLMQVDDGTGDDDEGEVQSQQQVMSGRDKQE